MKRSAPDYRWFPNGSVLMLLVWVDDIWAAFTKGTRKATFDPFMNIYQSKDIGYRCKSLGKVSRFVAIDVKHDEQRDIIHLSMESYITSMVPKFLTEEQLKVTEPLPAYTLDANGRTPPRSTS